MLRKSPGIRLTGTEGTKAGLLRNENTLVETGGGNNQMFVLELDADKVLLNKNQTTMQQDVFLENFSNRIHWSPYIFKFEMFLWKYFFCLFNGDIYLLMTYAFRCPRNNPWLYSYQPVVVYLEPVILPLGSRFQKPIQFLGTMKSLSDHSSANF